MNSWPHFDADDIKKATEILKSGKNKLLDRI